MRWTRSLPRRLAAVAVGLALASAGLAVVGTAGPDSPRREPARPATPAVPAPLFTTTEPAANKPVLLLQPDGATVHGWVAGDTNFAGKEVAVRCGGESDRLAVGPENTFTWTARVSEARTASFTLDPGGAHLTARTTVSPPSAPDRPSVFFVADRSAYRPGHTLKFTAFLRRLRADGEFEPVRDREVTVDLTSEKKRTRAARLKLTSDDFGRVVGSYTFSEADALDHYRLTADGFAGSARVMLGEYRKSKVGLKIKGEVKDGRLTLTFDARDFLDRPVKGLDASYTAQVGRQADIFAKTLRPEDFAHPEPAPPSADVADQLPDDERLLALAHGVSATTFAGLGSRAVATREGKVEFKDDGPGKVELDLNPEWLKGKHTVSVTGVLTDETGRENRAAAVIALDPVRTRGVRVSVPKESVAPGEKLPVAVETFGLAEKDAPITSLVVVRLDANPGSPWAVPAADLNADAAPDGSRLPAIGVEKPRLKKPTPPAGWTTFPVYDPVKRTVHSTVPVAEGKAEAAIWRAGAYKLLAVTRLADGTVLQGEAGVVVSPPTKLPAVVLKLDEKEVHSGSRLRGAVHTRFAGAKVLLTLRDATGVRLTKVLTASKAGVAAIDEPLPANLRYGCAVTAQYAESDTLVHADQRELFVVPDDRTIAVTTSDPGTVGPGAEVKLDIKVNRAEPVDLVVSVYDESLLGVTGDLAGNVRDFYLADARGLNRAARELAAQRVGNVTVAELIEKAERLLKDREALERDPVLQPLLSQLANQWRAGRLRLQDVATLVRLAGFEVCAAYPLLVGDSAVVPVGKDARLADLLRRPRDHGNEVHSVSAVPVGNVMLLTLTQRGDGDPWAVLRTGGYYRHVGQFGFQGYGIGGISGIGGFGGFGGHPGFGGIGGFQGALGGGIQGGIGGFGGGGIGGFGGSFNGTVNVNGLAQFQPVFPNAVAGIQGGFSHGFNRDFMGSGNSSFSFAGVPFPAGAPLPAIGGDDMIRRDFADSAFWTGNLRTDETGKATARFKVPDSLTGWRVVVTAVSGGMHVGAGVSTFRTSRPVMVWPMLPRAFTAGDLVSIFGTVHNLTDKPQEVRVRCSAENGSLLDDAERTITVPVGGSVPVYWAYRAGKAGWTDILMSADAPGGKDASLKRLPVTAAGVVERVTAAGVVGQGALRLTLPDGIDTTKATVQVTVAPTLAADLADTLPYLVDYPYGCVEQTMSRFLPAVKVAQILKRSGVKLPELEAKLPKVVEAGVKRLLELQQPDGGWGWQGNSGTHEMMTPYALYGLLEAEKAGYAIPNEHAIQAGLNRLKGFLAGIQGSLANPNPGASSAAQINDGLYCLWVLSHREKVPAEWWAGIARYAGTDTMSDYGHALALELAVKEGRRPLADQIAAELRKRAKRSGELVSWRTAGFSRWGDNTFEVTAAALKALVAYNVDDALVPGVLAFFQSTKRGDRWDSTKDTAVVLYALCDYLAAVKAGPAAAGEVTLAVNDGPARKLKLDGPLSKTLTLPGKDLKPGGNVLSIRGGGEAAGALARVVVKFTRGEAAVPAREHGIRVTRDLMLRGADGKWVILKSGATVPKGSYVRVAVTATPTAGNALSYTLVESPKPACGETVPADDRRFQKDLATGGYTLREDREAMTCFHVEATKTAVVAEYVFLAEFAGEFRLPPARAEMMYRPDTSGHSDSFKLTVK